MRTSRAKVAALQETATTSLSESAANSRACASAPARGGSNRTPSKAAELLGSKRPLKKVARRRHQRPQAFSRRRSVLERCDRGGVGIEAVNLAAARQAQREGAGAAEEIRDLSGVGQRFLGEVSQ